MLFGIPLCCDVMCCVVLCFAVLCCATSPSLVVISELLKVYRRWSARYSHVLRINTDIRLIHMPHMLPIDNMESFQTSLIDQALTSFYSWHPSVLSLCKSLMTVIRVACIAPSNMLRTDYIMFIRRLWSHILHDTAFRGVGRSDFSLTVAKKCCIPTQLYIMLSHNCIWLMRRLHGSDLHGE